MNNFLNSLEKEIKNIKDAGLYKSERIIESPQDSEIIVNNKNVLNFCANNYLGLSNNKKLIQAAQTGLEQWGFGLSSVRFICGTQSIHKQLENKISDFVNKKYRKNDIEDLSPFYFLNKKIKLNNNLKYKNPYFYKEKNAGKCREK